MRDAEFRDLETDFFRRGDELSESSIEPVDDFADLDQDSGIAPGRRRPWSSRPSLVAAGAGLLLLVAVGLVVAQRETAPAVEDGVLSRLAVEASASARPPIRIVVDLSEPEPPALDPVVLPLPATVNPPAAPKPSRPRTRARARRPHREAATSTVAVATRVPADRQRADARRVARVVSSRPGATVHPPSKAARRLRAMGHHYRKRGLRRPAAQAFRGYLRLAPGASDAAELRRLVNQLGG